MPPAASILLIDDDLEIAAAIADDLRVRGYAVSHASDGPAGLISARDGAWNALIVDRMLPGLDGLSLIRALRAKGRATPVLVLSALGEVDERIRGLREGGDDYLAKPFALAELAARLEALLRRPDPSAVTLRAGRLTIDLLRREARIGGTALDLLPRELRLLEYLARRPDRLVTRAMLLQDVWGYRFTPQSNVVDVHLGKLRRKLEAAGAAGAIENVRGEGFHFHAP